MYLEIPVGEFCTVHGEHPPTEDTITNDDSVINNGESE